MTPGSFPNPLGDLAVEAHDVRALRIVGRPDLHLAVSTWRGSNPRSTRFSSTRLLMRRPAPRASTSDRAHLGDDQGAADNPARAAGAGSATPSRGRWPNRPREQKRRGEPEQEAGDHREQGRRTRARAGRAKTSSTRGIPEGAGPPPDRRAAQGRPRGRTLRLAFAAKRGALASNCRSAGAPGAEGRSHGHLLPARVGAGEEPGWPRWRRPPAG